MNDLRTGIVGIGGRGNIILSALAQNDSYRIQAIADQDLELATRAAQEHRAQAYDDYRSLIVQEELDVLFLILPNFLCDDCIRLAAKKGLHVFKEAPLARSLPEAAEWTDLMKKAQRRFHIGAQKRFAPGYLEAHRLLAEQTIGDVYLARAESFLRFPGQFAWRGDPVLAGGGVLLENAGHMIDQIIWNLGPPERIYSLNTARCSRKTLPPYRTEDTALLSMKFPEGAMGSVLTGWMTTPLAERLIFHGTEGTIEVETNILRLYDAEGRLTLDDNYDVDETWLVAQQIRYFANLLLDPQITPVSAAFEHLANVAVIESAYLSARTQMPEPLKVYGPLFSVGP